MAGWRKGLAAGLTTLTLGFGLLNDISSGTNLSYDNSKLEKEVKTESFSKPQESFDVKHETEYLDGGGKKETYYIRGEEGYHGGVDSTVCDCIDEDGDGFYEEIRVLNDMKIKSLYSEDGDIKEKIFPSPSPYYVSEVFDFSSHKGSDVEMSDLTYKPGILFRGIPKGKDEIKTEYVDRGGFYDWLSLRNFELSEEFSNRVESVLKYCNEDKYDVSNFVRREANRQDYKLIAGDCGEYACEVGLDTRIPDEIRKDFYDDDSMNEHAINVLN